LPSLIKESSGTKPVGAYIVMARIILCIVIITLAFQSPLLAAWHADSEQYAVADNTGGQPSFPDDDPDPADEYSLPEAIYRFELPAYVYNGAYAPEKQPAVPQRPEIVHTPPPRMH
jgi:hypothetical protein